MYRDIPPELKELIEPIVIQQGFELVDVERLGGRGAQVLRVTIDTETGDGRVPVERCVEISREIGTSLDASEAMPAAYRLEVSSPGLDRHLAREKDFEAAVGSEVRVETRAPFAGRRRFRGRLLGFDGADARVRVDGDEVVIPFDAVSRANAIYEFTSADYGRGR